MTCICADGIPHTFPVAKLKKLHRISVAEKSLCRKRVASAAVQQEMSAEQPFSSRSGVVLLEDKGASAWMCRSPDFNDISYFPQQQAGHSVHFQDDRHDP